MRTSRRFLGAALITCLALALIPVSTGGAANGVTVSIDAPAVVEPGSDFVARVNIVDVIQLDTYQFDLTYDPAVIQVIGTEGGTEGVTAGEIDSTPIPIDMWGFIPPGTPGKVRVLTNVPGIAGASGTGYLCDIHFHVVGSIGNSTLAFSGGGLFDTEAQEITPVTWVDGLVQVCVIGDADGGGFLDMADITKVERMILEIDEAAPCADANGDGDINMLDVTGIERIILGIE